MILKQYEYEEGLVRTGVHLMHSLFFQSYIALACDLNVDNILPTTEAHKWSWFKRYCAAVRVAKALIRRTTLPKTFCLDVRKKLESNAGSGGPVTAAIEMSSSMTSSSSYYQSSSLQASIQNENDLSETFEKYFIVGINKIGVEVHEYHKYKFLMRPCYFRQHISLCSTRNHAFWRNTCWLVGVHMSKQLKCSYYKINLAYMFRKITYMF